MLWIRGQSESFVKASKDIEGGGVNINNVREPRVARAVATNDLPFGKHLLLRRVRKTMWL